MKRSVITTARLQTEALHVGGFRYRCAMHTLTYRGVADWRPRHVTSYIKAAREHLRRMGVPARYQTVMELQKRGAPHYHVLWWLPRGVTLPKPDKRGWWPHGLTRSEWARNAIGYLAKYASKGTDGAALPKGARLYGSGGLDAPTRTLRSWWMLPRWLRDRWGVEHRPTRVKGGWLSRESGEVLPSPWRIRWRSGDWSMISVEWVGFDPCPERDAPG